MIYSSYSHGIKGNRYRILIGTDKPYNKAELPATVSHALTLCSGEIADVKENSVWSQPWYLPRKPDATSEAIQLVYTGGDPLDMDTVYYWQVAVYDSAISTTVPSEVSPLYKFKTFDRYMEQLDRGLLAMNIGDGNVYLGWRMFKSDPSGPEFGFNVYRNGVKLTAAPITDSTNYLDN